MPDMERPFVVLSFTRSDLLNRGIPQERIEALTDEDMTQIADKLRDLYMKAGHGDNIEFYTKIFLVFNKDK